MRISGADSALYSHLLRSDVKVLCVCRRIRLLCRLRAPTNTTGASYLYKVPFYACGQYEYCSVTPAEVVGIADKLQSSMAAPITDAVQPALVGVLP